MLKKISQAFSAEIGQQQNNMKRFYKQANFDRNPTPKHPIHNYVIKLDNHTIKTPYRNILAVPSIHLAFLVAGQFNRQHKHIKSGEMPMLSLCRTAVDADVEGHLAQHLRHTIYQYLKTDTLLFVDGCYEKDFNKLAVPLIQNFKNKFKMQIKHSQNIDTPLVEINQTFTNWVQSLNNWQLIGFETMTIWMKSTIAAYSVIDSQHAPKDIQTATYLEQIAQMRSSGEVEQKIMDVNQIRLMISCGEMMFRMGKSDVLQ